MMAPQIIDNAETFKPWLLDAHSVYTFLQNKHSQSYRKDPIDRAMMGRKPEWLEKLLTEKRFFSACEVHKAEKKNENNVFCVDCHGAICQHCVPCHRHGYRQPSLLQVKFRGCIQLYVEIRLLSCPDDSVHEFGPCIQGPQELGLRLGLGFQKMFSGINPCSVEFMGCCRSDDMFTTM